MTSRALFRVTSLLAFTFGLTACGGGLSTPDIQEFWGTSDDTEQQLSMIVEEVKCELTRAAKLVMAENQEFKPVQGPLLDFLNTWGADVLFQFTIDEKTTLNPGVSFTPPLRSITAIFRDGTKTTTPQSESFNLGAQLSAEGYRQEKLHSFYKLSDLVGPVAALPKKRVIYEQVCTKENEGGTLVLQNDLKFAEWFRFVTNAQIKNEADIAAKNAFVNNGVVVHDVKFDIMSAGSFTPTIKLFRISANATSTLFNTSRDRTQEVIITLGPIASQDQLKPNAANSGQASEIKAGFDSIQPRTSP